MDQVSLWIYIKTLGKKMLLVCMGCYRVGVTNDDKKQMNSGENWLVCKHDQKMELFIISNQHKIKTRNNFSNKGQLRQLCDKNQITTIASKSSAKPSASVKLALEWKRWLGGKGLFSHFPTEVCKLKLLQAKSRGNGTTFQGKMYWQRGH